MNILPTDIDRIDQLFKMVPPSSAMELYICIAPLVKNRDVRTYLFQYAQKAEERQIATIDDMRHTITNIEVFVCKEFDAPHSLLRTKTRKREIKDARQIMQLILRKITGFSLAAVGKEYGKDHSTVIASCKTVDNVATTNTVYREKLLRIAEFVTRQGYPEFSRHIEKNILPLVAKKVEL